MSHAKKIPTAIQLLSSVFIFIASHCARLGEAGVTLSEQNMLPAQLVVTSETKPGMGSNGGPITWDFWVKDRKATSDAMLGSFLPFYKLNAIRLAVSAHFVFYRDSSDVTINAGQAATVLATMETAYNNLKSIYGSGEHPYTNDGARIVILAYNIQDDYSTTGNYVGGYFSPRDLYSNQFTKALFTEPVAIQQYSNLVGILGGYSNEMSIINYDLNPGYSTNAAQVNDIVIHELSHLFTYSRRVIKQRVTNHDLWIAEGIAENAPHQTIQTSDVQQLRLTQLASPSTIDYFQDAPQLTDFQKWAPKIVGYLQSNLFFNYLRHRAELQLTGSSATMLSELMTRLDSTIESIDFLIQKYIPGANFASLYGDYVMTHYLMLLGSQIQDTNGLDNAGGPGLNQRFSFCKSEIGISGTANNCTSIKSRYSTSIPFNFEAPKCADGTYGLNPNSYFIFRHKVMGDQPLIDSAGANPVNGELPLKYVVNPTTEATMLGGVPAITTLRTFDASSLLLPLSSQMGLASTNIVHILVYNPNKAGSCRVVDNSLVLKRNHSKWVGYNTFGTQASPDFDWQTDTGAVWVNSSDGGYNRPGAIAIFTGGRPPTTPVYSATNFLYVLDYNNMSLQRLDLDKGTPMGRLGSTSTTCPTTGSGWDSSTQRFVDTSCAHNFNAPRGLHVRPTGGSNHEIYVADSSNHRIVKYDQSGNFQGWLGLNGTCNAGMWQTAATVTDPTTLTNAGAQVDPCMFWLPAGIVSDSTHIYILDSAKHRLIKRNRVTGDFVGYIGNGQNGWSSNTANITSSPLFGYTAGYFDSPTDIILIGTNFYVADQANQRIVRIASDGTFTDFIGGGADGWKTSWASQPASGAGVRFFQNPTGLTADGTYLYITDRLNNRIVRWNYGSGAFAGWLGHGRVGWDTSSTAPSSDPYAMVSMYPPDYYAQPSGIVIAQAVNKDTKRNYLYMTSVFNGRVTRINLDCAALPGSAACDQVYDPFVQP